MEMKRKNFSIGEQLTGSMFILPALFFLIIFLILPACLAVGYSFFNYNMLKPQSKEFIGLLNYIDVFKDPSFYKVLGNTIYFVITVVPLQTIVALLLAILVNKKVATSKFARLCFFAPVVTSMVVISLLWTILYNRDNGLINAILSIFNIPPQPFLLSEDQAMNSIIIMSIWQAAGYQMMIFLAGLQDIAQDFYEAASIDGASKFQQFKYITVPNLKNVINFVILITTIQAFKLFTQPYVMTNGGPKESTKTLVYQIYEQGFQYRNVGYSSAMAVIMFVIIMVVTFAIKALLKTEEID
ncbi:ABC transporter permease [Candidatus Epulonipiscium fishelsonii]|nr:ABC transporter permease [Epulopiscium sp. SCG-C06WGA-EpuloA1]